MKRRWCKLKWKWKVNNTMQNSLHRNREMLLDATMKKMNEKEAARKLFKNERKSGCRKVVQK